MEENIFLFIPEEEDESRSQKFQFEIQFDPQKSQHKETPHKNIPHGFVFMLILVIVEEHIPFLFPRFLLRTNISERHGSTRQSPKQEQRWLPSQTSW